MRRAPLIIGIIIGVLVLIVASYFIFFRTPAPGLSVEPGGNPFQEGGDYQGGGAGSGALGQTGEAGEEVAPNLIKITAGPVAYGTLARTAQRTVVEETGQGTSTATSTRVITYTEVRYAERESGNVFAYDLDARTLTRVSNRTLPGVQEASWSRDGATAFLRFLSTNDGGGESLDTFALAVGRDDGGYFLESGLDQVLVTGSSTVITLLPSSTGSIATSARIDGTSAKTFFSSALSALRLYPAGTGLAAFTKASAQLDGLGFMISSAGTFTRVLGPYKGLTLLPSPSGKSILYSYASGASVTAGVLDVATRTTTAIPIAALPEKCVWAADETAVYCGVPRSMQTGWPDSWYQGVVSFSDRIWKVDMAARTASLVVDTNAVGKVEVDAVSLSIDPKSDALVFTNKKDGSLWVYDL